VRDRGIFPDVPFETVLADFRANCAGCSGRIGSPAISRRRLWPRLP